jgi:hypothetical protein
MSALGHKQTLGRVCLMSALPPKADIVKRCCDVRFVPCVDGSELARRIFTLLGRCSHVFGLFARFT